MADAILSKPIFQNEAAAFEYVEAHLWPRGPVCPHCGNVDQAKIGRLNARTKPSKKNPEGIVRHGLRKCYACKMEFTVRKGTIFEESHLPLHLWMQAIHMLNSSKKGISTRQIQRLLNCSMKTAWFLTHRIREMMKPADMGNVPPLGGLTVTVEADEAYIGATTGKKKGRGLTPKHPVVSLVERGGAVRSFHVPNVRAETVGTILASTVRKQSKLNTDESNLYSPIGGYFAAHETVNHTYGEYARGETTTNTVEGFFSILKRGLYGTYQHVSEAHLHRYLAEFDFRCSNRAALKIDDAQRTAITVRGGKGKRLTYERTREAQPDAA